MEHDDRTPDMRDWAIYERALFKALADWPEHERARLAEVFSRRGQEAAALAVEKIGQR